MATKTQKPTLESVAAIAEQLSTSDRAEMCRRLLIDMLATENDAARRAADSVLSTDYWRDVRSAAEDFKRAVKDGEIRNGDDADRWLNETVDGHSRIIYTALAAESLSYTDNADAWEDVGGEMTTEQRAYFAFRRDIEEQLSSDGIAWEDPAAQADEE
jgi:hypothetical protein